MAAKKKNKKQSKKTSAKKLKPAKKQTKRQATTKKKAAKKQPAKKQSAKRQPAKKARKKSSSGNLVPFTREKSRPRSGGQSGDLQGLSRVARADSESVDELLEEGNTFEAEAVAGVEKAGNADEEEVHTHELPEDDVPSEYLDKD